MFDRLEVAENRYEEINHRLSDPQVLGNQDEYRRLMKEHSELGDIVAKYREYKKVNSDIKEARELLDDTLDKDFREMVQSEFEDAREKLEKISKELKI